MSDQSPSFNVKPSIPILVSITLLGIFLAALWPTVQALHGEWYTPIGHFSHGYLLVAIGAVAIVQRIKNLSFSPPKQPVNWLLYLMLVGATGIWIIAHLAHVVAIQYGVFPVILALCLVIIFGFDSFRHVFAPAFIFILALPLWEILNQPLQQISTVAVGQLMTLMHVPHLINGTYVTIAAGNFEIAGGCSGLSFLLTSLSLATAILIFSRTTIKHSIVLYAGAIFIALAANWLRIAVIIWVGNKTNMRTDLVDDHLWLGWLVYGFIAVPFFYWASGKMNTVNNSSIISSNRVFPSVSIILCFTVLLGVLSLQHTLLSEERTLSDDALLVKVPASLVACSNSCSETWEPRVKGADLMVWFEPDANLMSIAPSLRVNIARYAVERQEKELIYYANKPQGNLPISSRIVNPGEYTELMGSTRSNSNYIIRYWYDVNGRRITDKWLTKAHQVIAKLKGQHVASRVAIYATCESDCESEREIMSSLQRELTLSANR